MTGIKALVGDCHLPQFRYSDHFSAKVSQNGGDVV